MVTVYIPTRPLVQAEYSILIHGTCLKSKFPLCDGTSMILQLETLREITEAAAFVVTLVLWSMATLRVIYSATATIDVIWHNKVQLKQTFWSLVFPNVSRGFSRASARVWPFSCTTLQTRRSSAPGAPSMRCQR